MIASRRRRRALDFGWVSSGSSLLGPLAVRARRARLRAGSVVPARLPGTAISLPGRLDVLSRRARPRMRAGRVAPWGLPATTAIFPGGLVVARRRGRLRRGFAVASSMVSDHGVFTSYVEPELALRILSGTIGDTEASMATRILSGTIGDVDPSKARRIL